MNATKRTVTPIVNITHNAVSKSPLRFGSVAKKKILNRELKNPIMTNENK
jgi:hypothetical protein